jgi:O-acetyl-ADP-ribose deacetylase (regulator of RNase III)/uncharacterized protein YwgA
MIKRTTGDLLKADAEALVNTVNCVGVMGRGVALQFKKKFPKNYAQYKKACDAQEVTIGKMLIFPLGTLSNPRFIINFPTKEHWRGHSQLSYIEDGLEALVAEVKAHDIRSVAIPPLGCGLGGLEWNEVRPLIERAFTSLTEVEVLLYEPSQAPKPSEQAREAKVPNMTPGRAILLTLIQHYQAGFMDTTTTLLQIHKLMYFMQALGEPLKLKYEEGSYGPYAENLRHVLNAIEGHFTTGYGDGNDNPENEIDILPEGIAKLSDFALEISTQERLSQVKNLIEGFETPFGLELLATVHWVAKRDNTKAKSKVTKAVHNWNTRKKMFTPEQIEIALLRLKTVNLL